MSHTLISAPLEHSVFLTCEGEMSLTEMTAAWREVQAVLAETGWAQVLVDVTAVQTSPDTAELFDLAKLFWRDFPPGGRMALVVRWEQTWFAKSLEMLVRNVGVHLTVFVSQEQAGAWLLGEPARQPQMEEFAN